LGETLISKNRQCHDCERMLAYGTWIEIHCTIGGDETATYCQPCFLVRMRKYVAMYRNQNVPEKGK